MKSKVPVVAFLGFGVILPAGLLLGDTPYIWNVIVASWFLTALIELGFTTD